MDSFDRQLEELVRAIYGYPSLGQKGFREEIEMRAQRLEADIEKTTELCENLVAQRREEAAERRGMKRLVGYTGATSGLTLLTLVGLLISIWNGAGG